MHDLTEIAFGEKLALVFWQCAFWAVSTVYGSVVSYHSASWAPLLGFMVYVPKELRGEASGGHESSVMEEKSIFRRASLKITEFTTPSKSANRSPNALSTKWPLPPAAAADASAVTDFECAGFTSADVSSEAADTSEPIQSCSSAPATSLEPSAAVTSAAVECASSGPGTRAGHARAVTRAAHMVEHAVMHAAHEVQHATIAVEHAVEHAVVHAVKAAAMVTTFSTKKDAHDTICIRVWEYHLLRFVIGLALSMWWPILYALIIDSLTGLSPSLSSTFLVGFVLVLNSQVFESIGRLLAEIAGMSGVGVGVTFASIFSQTLVIAGGFYKTVPASGPPVAFKWVSYINGLKYSFTAVARLWFSWQMPVWSVPQAGQPGYGYTWKSIEVTPVLNALKMRGVTVVDSTAGADHLSIVEPVCSLVYLIVGVRAACWLVASVKAFRANKAARQLASQRLSKQSEPSNAPKSRRSHLSKWSSVDALFGMPEFSTIAPGGIDFAEAEASAVNLSHDLSKHANSNRNLLDKQLRNVGYT